MQPDSQLTQVKAQARDRLLAARMARPAADLAACRDAITTHILIAAKAKGWRRVAAYEPMRTEPGSTDLLLRLADAGVAVLVPLLLPDNDLSWRAWGDQASDEADALGVDAITDIDAVFVPALAVSTAGVRLGRGGGSYDRALRRVADGTGVYALLFDEEILAELPQDDWDIPVEGAVTPSGWHTFEQPA